MNGCRQTVLAIYNDEGLRFRMYKMGCKAFMMVAEGARYPYTRDHPTLLPMSPSYPLPVHIVYLLDQYCSYLGRGERGSVHLSG